MLAFRVMITIKTKGGVITVEHMLIGDSEDSIYEILKKSFGKDLIHVQFLTRGE